MRRDLGRGSTTHHAWEKRLRSVKVSGGSVRSLPRVSRSFRRILADATLFTNNDNEFGYVLPESQIPRTWNGIMRLGIAISGYSKADVYSYIHHDGIPDVY